LIGIAVGALLGLAEAAAGQVMEADERLDGARREAEVEATSFWTALGDPALERLIEAALAGNRDLDAAAARVEGAKASRTHAALELAPIVTANAGYARRRFSSYAFPGGGAGVLPDQDVWDAGLTGSWEIDAFGRVRGNVGARGAGLAAAEEDVRGTELAVSAEVASVYFQLRGLEEQLGVAHQNADNQQRTLELTQARLAAGRGTELDVERARGQLAFTLAAVPALQAEVEAAEHRIAVLVGRTREEIQALLPSASGTPALPVVVPAVSADQVLGRRPDVRGAERRVSASRAATASARAEYLPRLSVVGTAGYTAQAVDAFGRTGTFNYAVGPVISWAAFDLGRVKARTDEAQAQEVEARARYEETELRAVEDLGAATARYEAGRARLAYLQESARASERAAALARARFEGGVADFLEVLDAERTLLVAQDQLAQARTAAAEAYVGLYRARGGVWKD
jgi:NodT family efflux transporter outer membrane factor (OMF) lipoprotein